MKAKLSRKLGQHLGWFKLTGYDREGGPDCCITDLDGREGWFYFERPVSKSAGPAFNELAPVFEAAREAKKEEITYGNSGTITCFYLGTEAEAIEDLAPFKLDRHWSQ